MSTLSWYIISNWSSWLIIHCMVVYCLVLSFVIPSVEGKGGAVRVWVIYFVCYSIYKQNKRDKSGWSPWHHFTQWTHSQVFWSYCTSCKYKFVSSLFACCRLCYLCTMPRFTHHKVTFPFPVLACCAYFRFLIIILENYEGNGHQWVLR